MPKLSRCIAGILILVTLFFAIPLPTYAQSTTGVAASGFNWGPGPQWQYSIFNILSGIFGCALSGQSLWKMVDPQADEQCMKEENGQISLYNKLPEGGALAGISNMMTAMYVTPPVSSGYYLADMGKHISVQPAYAQSTPGIGGSGDAVLHPVLQIWSVMRNISYLGFVLVFISIGFMIMFRRKMNPQTVISVQAALPGLVIGMVLVTFSYFIASLIVDISFVTMQLVGIILSNAGPSGIPNVGQAANGKSVLDLFWIVIWNEKTFNNINGPITEAFNGILPSFLNQVPAVGKFLSGGISIFVLAIIICGLFIQMVKLFWALLQAYIVIIINTIFGPIFILVSTIPGRSGALSYWWKGLLGNVLIFPAVFAVFLLGGLILGTNDPAAFTHTPPLLEGFPAPLIQTMLAYGLFLASPAIPGLVKNLLGVKDAGDIAKAAFGGFTTGFGIASGGVRGAGKFAFGDLNEQRKHYQQNLAGAAMGDERPVDAIAHAEESMRGAANRNPLAWLRNTYIRGVPNVVSRGLRMPSLKEQAYKQQKIKDAIQKAENNQKGTPTPNQPTTT